MKNILLIAPLLFTIINASELDAMQKACENKVATACYELGILQEQGLTLKKNSTKAQQYYLKACEYGYDKACKNFEFIKIED